MVKTISFQSPFVSIRLVVTASVAMTAGCIGPLVSDDVTVDDLILPPGTDVPSLHDDPVAEARITEFDGVDGLIERVNGFAGGAAIAYWDFGPSPAFAAPLFVLQQRNSEGELVRVAQPGIIAVVPGDPSYSPFWSVFLVEVTDQWNGEVIASVEAVQLAEELGLVKTPVLQPVAINCPIVARGVSLELEEGASPQPATNQFFYEGSSVNYFDVGEMALNADGTAVPEAFRFSLRGEGLEPLSELLRNVDLNGDGDLNDTNEIFDSVPAVVEQYAPLTRTVNVAVAPDTTFGLFQAADVLFSRDVDGALVARQPVRSFQVGETLRNLPQAGR